MVIVFEMIGRMKKYVIDANALISLLTPLPTNKPYVRDLR
jgi:hypothetical protein